MPYINDLKDSGFQIAGYLDLTTNWASIEKTNSDPADCLVALLDMWLNDTEVETCPHTWDYFIHIVRKLRKGKLADKMAKGISSEYIHIMYGLKKCQLRVIVEHTHSLDEREREFYYLGQ